MMWLITQCDQIERLFRDLGTNFVTKIAKMFSDNFGLFWHFVCRTAVDTYFRENQDMFTPRFCHTDCNQHDNDTAQVS